MDRYFPKLNEKIYIIWLIQPRTTSTLQTRISQWQSLRDERLQSIALVSIKSKGIVSLFYWLCVFDWLDIDLFGYILNWSRALPRTKSNRQFLYIEFRFLPLFCFQYYYRNYIHHYTKFSIVIVYNKDYNIFKRLLF